MLAPSSWRVRGGTRLLDAPVAESMSAVGSMSAAGRLGREVRGQAGELPEVALGRTPAKLGLGRAPARRQTA